MTRIWLRENKLQGLFRRERMRVYKTVTISELLLFKKKQHWEARNTFLYTKKNVNAYEKQLLCVTV